VAEFCPFDSQSAYLKSHMVCWHTPESLESVAVADELQPSPPSTAPRAATPHAPFAKELFPKDLFPKDLFQRFMAPTRSDGAARC
jgi:hypothetical protein